MKTCRAARELIQSYEKCALRAYPDPLTKKAPYTVGWGQTGPDIGPDTVWTQEQADARFEEALTEREKTIDSVVTVRTTENQYGALVSILYNVGHGSKDKDGIIVLRTGKPSTLLRFLNLGEYGAAGRQFLLWCSPGTAVERGLYARRVAEKALWDTP